MTKVYKINGGTIRKEEKDYHGYGAYSMIVSLLEALDEKKEEDWCKRCEKFNVHHMGECPFKKKEEIKWTKCDCMYYDGIERKCALHLKLQKEEEPKYHACADCGTLVDGPCEKHNPCKEEPKSTLKKEIFRIIDEFHQNDMTAPDKIISLFKDTLLKEMGEVLNLYMESTDGKPNSHNQQLQYNIAQAIINLIKNL